jgi:hypothetical protein
VLVALEIAQYRHAHSLEVRVRQEQALQIAFTDALSPEGDWQAGLLKAARLFQPYVPFDYLVMGLENDGQSNAFRPLSFLPHRPG